MLPMAVNFMNPVLDIAGRRNNYSLWFVVLKANSRYMMVLLLNSVSVFCVFCCSRLCRLEKMLSESLLKLWKELDST